MRTTILILCSVFFFLSSLRLRKTPTCCHPLLMLDWYSSDNQYAKNDGTIKLAEFCQGCLIDEPAGA